MKEVILVPVSGGLDSTYMLWHFLTKTDYKVYAHHISLRADYMQRWIKEDETMPKIVNYCRKIRDFDYTTSMFSSKVKCTSKDSDLVFTVMSRVASSIATIYREKVTLATGVCPDDLEHGNNRERTETINNKLWKVLIESMVDDDIRPFVNPELYRVLLDENVSKQDMVDRMPPELVNLTWSCRIPTTVGGILKECGNCLSCRQRKELGI